LVVGNADEYISLALPSSFSVFSGEAVDGSTTTIISSEFPRMPLREYDSENTSDIFFFDVVVWVWPHTCIQNSWNLVHCEYRVPTRVSACGFMHREVKHVYSLVETVLC
jgi:hypothetical protein